MKYYAKKEKITKKRIKKLYLYLENTKGSGKHLEITKSQIEEFAIELSDELNYNELGIVEYDFAANKRISNVIGKANIICNKVNISNEYKYIRALEVVDIDNNVCIYIIPLESVILSDHKLIINFDNHNYSDNKSVLCISDNDVFDSITLNSKLDSFGIKIYKDEIIDFKINYKEKLVKENAGYVRVVDSAYLKFKYDLNSKLSHLTESYLLNFDYLDNIFADDVTDEELIGKENYIAYNNLLNLFIKEKFGNISSIYLNNETKEMIVVPNIKDELKNNNIPSYIFELNSFISCYIRRIDNIIEIYFGNLVLDNISQWF